MQTPYYIFNEKKFKELILKYKHFGEMFFPIKANDDPVIVKRIIGANCAFEVDSIEHIKLLIEGYNVQPDKIIYSFPLKKSYDIVTASELGVTKFVVDCIEEYNNIRTHAKNPVYLLRINANSVVGGLNPMQDKWGFSIDDLKDAYHKITANNDAVLGISFYLSSEINSQENFVKIFDAIESLNIHNIEVVDIGGGVPVEMLEKLDEKLKLFKQRIGFKRLIIEPGRPLLDPCIDLAVSVIARRVANDGKNILFIDAGIYYGLLDVIIKKKRFDIFDIIEECENKNKAPFYVCGFSSDVSDLIGEYMLNADIKVGDKLIFKNCGAYSAVMATRFYANNKAPMIVINN